MNRFRQQIYSLAGQYRKPIPTRFLAPIDCSKIPALIIVQQERIPALSWTTSSLLRHSKHTTATGSGWYSTAARSHQDSSASPAKKIRPLEKNIRTQILVCINFIEMDPIRVEISLHGNHIT